MIRISAVPIRIMDITTRVPHEKKEEFIPDSL
jgi:hypothetical protein